jgi:hypothetical protein
MAATMVEIFGTVHTDGTLELSQKLTVPPGRVKVRVESVEAPAKPHETLVQFVERSRREMEAGGHKFMNDDEVTAYVEEMRNDSDDDRLEEVYR